MIRYAITPITGDGSENDPYRSTASGLPNVNLASVIPVDPETGIPIYGFCLLVLGIRSEQDFTPTNSYLFPDLPLDVEMSSVPEAVRTAFTQSVNAFNLDGNGATVGVSFALSDSWRDVVNSVGQVFEPAFTVSGFSVLEP